MPHLFSYIKANVGEVLVTEEPIPDNSHVVIQTDANNTLDRTREERVNSI